MKGLGYKSNNNIKKLPSHASYQIAREVFRTAPEADAIYITCTDWEVSKNLDAIEKDLGKPVVTCIQARVWVALSALHIRGLLRAYGKLLGDIL